MEQAIGGGHVCSAVRRKRRRAPAGDHSTRIRSSAERDRPEASHAAQALSPVRLRKTNLYHFVLGKNKVSRCTTYLLVALDANHLPEDPKILQQMVLDLMAQLDREHTERNKNREPVARAIGCQAQPQ